MNIIHRKINSIAVMARKNLWRVHPDFRDNPDLAIDRPIFLLGTQGGGLTLLGRILRRHPTLITTTGDCRYWAGPHEMHNVFRDILPRELTWKRLDIPGFDRHNHLWLYASDRLLPHYRADETAATDELSERLKVIIRKSLNMHGDTPDSGRRFLDKSQSYTVKLGLIHALLKDCSPRYVLILRNPYAMIWRAVTRVQSVMALPLEIEDSLEISIQHWRNSYLEALKYEHVVDIGIWRFEDILNEPESRLKEICSHIEIEFLPQIMPGADDHIPFGSNYDAFNRHKWYPIRKDVSDKYFEEIPDWAIRRISEACAPLIERFEYDI